MNKLRALLAGRMIPEIDALPFDEREIGNLSQDWKEQVDPWALRVCDVLKPEFGDALLLHKIPDLIQLLISSLDLSRICVRAGLVYTSLDFFYARQCPPNARHPCRRDSAQKLLGYIINRALDFVTLSFAKIAAWLAVLKGIPEQWVPGEKISQRLQVLIRTTAKFAPLEVELDLRLPPGGKRWLRRESLANFSALQKNRRDKTPEAAALLMECSNQIEILPVLVVQSYVNGSHGIVEFFDPFFPQDVRSVHLDLQSGDLQWSVSSPCNIYGFMALPFQPHAPLVSDFQALQASLHVAPLTWYGARLWRLATLLR